MKIIAIGLLTLAIATGAASAQTPGEHARILRGFDQHVADYLNAEEPASRIITLPVAMVFRQVIARALAERDGVAAINGVGTHVHVQPLAPFPLSELHDFPRVLKDALPQLPAQLEYRLIGNDLVLRDLDANLIVGVVRDAVGGPLTVRR